MNDVEKHDEASQMLFAGILDFVGWLHNGKFSKFIICCLVNGL